MSQLRDEIRLGHAFGCVVAQGLETSVRCLDGLRKSRFLQVFPNNAVDSLP